MPDFAVSTVFRANDRVTRAFGRMNRGANKFGIGASRAFRRASRSGSRFGDIVKGILTAGAIRKGVALLSTGLRTATTEFISFDDALKASIARFGDLRVNTIVGQKSIAELGKIARQVGAQTEFTATQAAQGLEFFALAGFSAKQSIAALPATVDFATAANIELARAVDIGTDAVGAFGLVTKDTVQLQNNFIRVNDLLAATVASSNTDMEQLFESIKAGGNTFVNSGQSIETFNALVGKMASKGEKGEKAGTALRNVMLRLANPSREAASALGFLGIQVADQKGDFRDIIDIIADFEKETKKLGTQERAAALDIIFGKKAINAFNVILGEGSKSLRSYREELMNSGGASERMANIMRDSLGKRLAALKSAAIEVGFKFLEAFQGKGKGAIENVTAALRRVDVMPVVNGIKFIGRTFKDLFDFFMPTNERIMTAIRGFGDSFRSVSPIVENTFQKIKTSFSSIVEIISGTILQESIIALGKIFESLKPIAVDVFDAIGDAISALQKPIKFLSQGLGLVIRLAGDAISAVAPLLQKVVGGGIGAIRRTAGFFGIGVDKNRSPTPATPPNRREVIPPNREDVLFRSRQQVDLSGRIDLAGAPDGTTFELFNAPKIKPSVLGANP